MSCSLDNKVITVKVGVLGDEFAVHEGAIRKSSEFFDKALKRALGASLKRGVSAFPMSSHSTSRSTINGSLLVGYIADKSRIQQPLGSSCYSHRSPVLGTT